MRAGRKMEKEEEMRREENIYSFISILHLTNLTKFKVANHTKEGGEK
jgi:hypothetical protein